MKNKLICLLLVLVLVSGMVLPVFATQSEEVPEETLTYEKILAINSVDAFLTFAKNCMLDAYSRNLRVTLRTDLDLSGFDFTGIPIFCGSFDGNGHTISGLSIDCDGSSLGLFRYVTAGAVVKNLNVEGSVQPKGSRCQVGGIVGENSGLLENCQFLGTVIGSDTVGGIVGNNTVTGVVSRCQVRGQVQGDHFTGGITGENMGLVRSSVNFAQVNITPQQNSVELSDITLDTLTSSESAGTVTDIGGIAGSSGGMILDCDNFAHVGYPHMGYNIGGIAGSQMGHIADCQNFGQVAGRKEVGGIVGQMEPVTSIVYTTDALQVLKGQLEELGAAAERASANAQGSAGAISGQIGNIQQHASSAKDAIDMLLPSSGQLPDADRIQAAQSALSSSVSGIQGSLQGVSNSTQSLVAGLSGDLKAITKQINAMSDTLSTASENLGGTLTDVSDADTPENIIGKVSGCINYGVVLADLNVGGIAGAINLENDLDPEADVDITGELSLNFEGELRAVIANCENTALITTTKQNGGGIVGNSALGLIRDCLNSGTVSGTDADYIGGIAGQSSGFIRNNYANCIVSGKDYVGGIAGTAKTVTNCRSMVQLTATEKGGAVLGYAEDRSQIQGNNYFTLETDTGAIDGISYDGCAQGLTREAFLAQEELPPIFHRITLTFSFADGTVQKVNITPGDPLDPALIPELPPKSGCTAHWDGLDSLDVYFDTVYYACYTPYVAVMESARHENGKPILLAEGTFLPGGCLSVTEVPAEPQLQRGLIPGLSLGTALPESLDPISLHVHWGQETPPEAALVLTGTNTWQEVPFHTSGSYVVLEVPADTFGVCLAQKAPISPLWFVLVGICVAAAAFFLVLRLRKKNAK